MPTMSTSGYNNFLPAASDAYSALLSRMPAWAEEGMARKRRMADIAEKDAGQAHYAREEQLKRDKEMDQERRDVIRKSDADKVQARKDAASAKLEERMRERGERNAYAKSASDRAARYGGDPFAAGKNANVSYSKMRAGIPGAY